MTSTAAARSSGPHTDPGRTDDRRHRHPPARARSRRSARAWRSGTRSGGTCSAAACPARPRSTRASATPASGSTRGPRAASPAATCRWCATSCSTSSSIDHGVLIPLQGHTLGRGGAGVRRGAVPRAQRLGHARSGSPPSRGCAARSRSRTRRPTWRPRRSGCARATRGSSRCCCRPAGSSASGAGATGRSTRPRRRPGCRSLRTPAAWSSTAAPAGRRSTSRSTCGTATRWPR